MCESNPAKKQKPQHSGLPRLFEARNDNFLNRHREKCNDEAIQRN
jgi:hypothetical protein